VGSCKIPIHSGSRISITVSGLRFQLFPGYSWLRIRYPDMIVVSGTDPDDGSFSHLRTTGYGPYPVVSRLDPDDGSYDRSRTRGYGSYPMVSCLVAKYELSVLKSMRVLKSKKWISNIGAQMRMLLNSLAHYKELLLTDESLVFVDSKDYFYRICSHFISRHATAPV
jgi:hypothetical protein